ncbi:MAG: MerC domain-containing protein [Pacificimonas sp.]
MARGINSFFDRIAIGLSGLCLVHCLFGALFVAVLSASGSALFGHDVHRWGLAIAVPLAILGLVGGAMSHGRWQAVAVGGFGIGAMAAALIAGHGPREVVLTILGVVLVGIAHALNIRWAAKAR